MPGSLEAFYQEAGRAGRNRDQALCYVIFSEYDEKLAKRLVDSSASLENIREDLAKIQRDIRDDTSDSLWFHLNSFQGIELELEEIESMLKQLGDLSQSRRAQIPFTDQNKSVSQEKAIYRLVQVGVLSDYEVEYGSKKFIVYVTPFDMNHCLQKILDYVRRSQPGRIKSIERKLETIPSELSTDGVLKLCRVMIEFLYDVIERSRRRAIQESMELARYASDDTEFRRRLLDYLQEGIDATTIQELVDRPGVDFTDWFLLIDKINSPMEAGELRGICIRFLESYADHPGLLIIRAVTEAMCSDSDETICYQSLLSAFDLGQERYSLSEYQVETGLQGVIRIALAKAITLVPSLTFSINELRERGRMCARLYSLLVDDIKPIGDERTMRIFRAFGMKKSASLLFDTTKKLTTRYENLHLDKKREVKINEY